MSSPGVQADVGWPVEELCVPAALDPLVEARCDSVDGLLLHRRRRVPADRPGIPQHFDEVAEEHRPLRAHRLYVSTIASLTILRSSGARPRACRRGR